MDIEFTQKLENIMGKGGQTLASNISSAPAAQILISKESEDELAPSKQLDVQQDFSGNSRFSISPVSNSRPIDLTSAVGK